MTAPAKIGIADVDRFVFWALALGIAAYAITFVLAKDVDKLAQRIEYVNGRGFACWQHMVGLNERVTQLEARDKKAPARRTRAVKAAA